MIHSILRLSLCAAALAGGLAACGGGDNNIGDVAGGATNPPPGGGAPASEVPASAQQSIAGLVAFLNDLIATRTDETSEPIVLGDAVLPTSETSEPL